MSSPYETQVWNWLLPSINNALGVAALMGNLQAESGIIPYRLEGDFTTGYTKSIEYTDKVNNGSISASTFIGDSKGYGLAQWTYHTRKQNLYNFRPLSQVGIGDLDRQCPFLISELQSGYPTVWSALINATSIRSASDVVLTQFENPAAQYQTEEQKEYRASLGQAIYSRQHGSPEPTPPGPTPPTPTPTPGGTPPIWMLGIAKKKLR